MRGGSPAPELVRWFRHLGRGDLALAGGKGANLAELFRAGLPVPEGFVLLTPAYHSFVAENRLQPEIERLASGVRPEDPSTAEVAGAGIRERFAAAAMPEPVARAVAEALALLGEGPVAVRSSATAEDLPGASFAGQQESYLHLEGPDAVLAAVKACWASLWTARALAYRARLAISPAEVALAVVVQPMVAAEAAGVLFTANPVNGRRDQMVVDGAWGLGEAVVSGQVNPDHWVVDAATGAVLEHRPGQKQVMTAPRPGGTQLVAVPAEQQQVPALDPAGLAALVQLGRQAAAHFGAPQDIEWARAGGRFYLLQSRPITSLFPLPAPPPGPDEPGLRVYVCYNLAQGFPEPFTPMGGCVFQEMVRGIGGFLGVPLRPGGAPMILKQAAGRVYADATEALQHPRLRQRLAFNLGRVEPRTLSILEWLAGREPQLAPWRRGRAVKISLKMLMEVMGGMVSALTRPEAARQKALARVEALVQGVEERAGCLQGVAERRRFVSETMSRLRAILSPLVAVAGVGWVAEPLARRALEKWLGDGSLLDPVLRSFPYNPTTEMDLALWQVAHTLRAEGATPAAHHPAIRAFLDRYGHRAIREIDVGIPRWREEPGYLLQLLSTYQSQGDAGDAAAHFAAGAAAAEEAVAELVARVHRERGRLKAWTLQFLLHRLRALGGVREAPKYYTVRVLAAVRQVIQGAGAELAAAGLLDQADDLFWLELDEMMALAGGAGVGSPAESGARAEAGQRQLIAERKATYRAELDRRRVPRVVTSTGETFYEPPAGDTGEAPRGVLTGTPASPGVYEGRVRIVRDPAGARLEPGEVLVAPGTDPAWTPLFLSAGALVMETGGMMSHGTVVAREYGIPAVVGVPGATERLETGQRVRVDGGTGTIIPL